MTLLENHFVEVSQEVNTYLDTQMANFMKGIGTQDNDILSKTVQDPNELDSLLTRLNNAYDLIKDHCIPYCRIIHNIIDSKVEAFAEALAKFAMASILLDDGLVRE